MSIVQILRIMSVFLVFLFFSSVAFANGDATKGDKLFQKKCKGCHTISIDGKNKIGPNLYKIFKRTIGSAKKFRYKGLKDIDLVWNNELLDEFLKNPKKFTQSRGKRKSSMMIRLRKKKDREDVISFLAKSASERNFFKKK